MLRCTETAVLPVSVGLEGDAEEEVKLLRAAVHVMHVVPKAANDMMNVGRLQGYNVRYDGYDAAAYCDDDDEDDNDDDDYANRSCHWRRPI